MVRDGDAADRDNDFRHASKHPDAGNGPQDFEDEATEIKRTFCRVLLVPTQNSMADMNLNPTLVIQEIQEHPHLRSGSTHKIQYIDHCPHTARGCGGGHYDWFETAMLRMRLRRL